MQWRNRIGKDNIFFQQQSSTWNLKNNILKLINNKILYQNEEFDIQIINSYVLLSNLDKKLFFKKNEIINFEFNNVFDSFFNKNDRFIFKQELNKEEIKEIFDGYIIFINNLFNLDYLYTGKLPNTRKELLKLKINYFLYVFKDKNYKDFINKFENDNRKR